jgi:hypothetical protein
MPHHFYILFQLMPEISKIILYQMIKLKSAVPFLHIIPIDVGNEEDYFVQNNQIEKCHTFS